jgi:hypothetical protein
MRHALQTTCVREIVEGNIRRGIKYRFILPVSENGERHEAREALWRIFTEHSGDREIYELPQHEFTKLAVTHFLMLNPKVEDEQNHLRVFLELPVVGQHNYWIEVDKEAAYTFVERFDTVAAKTATL